MSLGAVILQVPCISFLGLAVTLWKHGWERHSWEAQDTVTSQILTVLIASKCLSFRASVFTAEGH